MHAESMRNMADAIATYCKEHVGKRRRVLDVGSRIVDGGLQDSYRSIMPAEWIYTGCDVEAGANVDIVMEEEYALPRRGAGWDIIISGQCFEHVRWPWELFCEIALALAPNGIAILSAPWKAGIHRYPVDCWRILPDGWQALCEWGGLHVVKTWTCGGDSLLVARRGHEHVNP